MRNESYSLPKVYPRTHGETIQGREVWFIGLGLSPYTRGNLAVCGLHQETGGSIPVHTGKPGSIRLVRKCRGVYPRTHGETTEHNIFEYDL